MGAEDCSFEEACRQLHDGFFSQYPNAELQRQTNLMLKLLLEMKMTFPGQPGNWAGAIVYAASGGAFCDRGASNADFEKAFGTTMGAVRDRAARVMRALGRAQRPQLDKVPAVNCSWTLRDEANAICAYAFRNGPLERIHHEYHIADADMKEFNISASEHLAKLMAMKRDTPQEYERFIRHYHSQFCQRWER